MDLQQSRSDWTILGADDPLWAVLALPGQRNRRWDREEFLATGRREVTASMARCAELGLTPAGGRALDFGCGAGRLSGALADFADEVVGVDISPSMLAAARELHPTRRCRFVENYRSDLSLFADQSFDIVYSSLALQHIPTELARGYLSEMLRVVRNSGVVIVQVATAPDYSVRGLLARVAPRAALRFAQMRMLGYPAPMDMYPLTDEDVRTAAARHGGEIVEASDDAMYGGHWRYRRYFLTRHSRESVDS